MKQLVQNLKTGKMQIIEAPVPTLLPKNILVRVHTSLISAGTEAVKVSTARKGYIGKAKEKPEQVKQVIDTMKKEGISNTYRKVMNKLNAWAPLGYSCAGEIIKIGSEVKNFKLGDRVACAGQDIANHAEVVSVPFNLCTKLLENVSFDQAAYTTLGAIALQGLRQADLRLGESCAVIGLGLLGQLTVQMLKASGLSVYGIDVDQNTIEPALKSGANAAFQRIDDTLEQGIVDATGGYGVDAVIITAGTSSLDPVELAGKLCRKKGKVVIVGAVPTGFSRANYYNKELDLRMSSSYGPGRYDPDYEGKGIDYPYGYVRWTENRNMQAFVNLIDDGSIKLDHLTTHTFDINKANQAYDMIMEKNEPYLGILLRYDSKKKIESTIKLTSHKKNEKVNIGFIGPGSFAQNFLLPNLQKNNHVDFISVCDAVSHNARTVAERYNFVNAVSNPNDIINNPDINTVFIATRHDSHGQLVISALKSGKNVYVEKPLAMTLEEINQIHELYQNLQTATPIPVIMVGFNRRFAPYIKKVKELFKDNPVAINYRINAGFIPKEHWSQDPEFGGGRIIGEVCHFVDLAMFLSSSKPSAINAFAFPDAQQVMDTLSVNLNFANGSVANISYYSNGSKALPKEYLEVYANGVTAIVNDFKELHIYGKSHKKSRSIGQDKGHQNEVCAFVNSIKEGSLPPIPFDELYISSLLPFKIIESIQNKQTITFGNYF